MRIWRGWLPVVALCLWAPIAAAQDDGGGAAPPVEGESQQATFDAGEEILFDDGFGPDYDDGDPWEGYNRAVFSFNELVDRNVLEKVAIGWDFVLPDPVQIGIRNIFDNFRFPTIFINNLLQGKPLQAGEDLGRFVLNTTIGVLGIMDPAKEAGWTGNDEDFGQTLGVWGVPPGPYFVIPLLGPSSPRDTVGLAGDAATRIWPWFSVWYITAAITTGNLLNRRSLFIEEIRSNRETSFDYYAFVRNAYMSYRENKVRDSEGPAEETPDDDLYYFEDEEEEEEVAPEAIPDPGRP